MRKPYGEASAGTVYLIEDAGGGEAGVETEGDGPGDLAGLLNGVLEKQVHPLGRRGVSGSESGVDESLSQALRFEVPVRGEVGRERRVDGLLIVSVVDRSLLLAVGLDGKAVDVDDAQAHPPVASAETLMAEDGLNEKVAERLAVVPVGQKGDEPRRCRLRSETLVRHPASRPVPYGGFEGGVVGETVCVVLAGEAHGDGVDSFAEKFGHGVTDEALVAGGPESGGKRVGQT